MIERSQVLNWEHDPVTLYFKSLIQQTVDLRQHQLATGGLLNLPDLAEKYNYTIGFMDGLRFVLEAELSPEETKDEDTRSPYS